MDEIKCDYCDEVYEFEDDGSVDCMPDGWILPTHEWICLDCGSCPECGKSQFWLGSDGGTRSAYAIPGSTSDCATLGATTATIV